MKIILLITLFTLASVLAAPKQCHEMNRILCNINEKCAWNFENTLCLTKSTINNFSQPTSQALNSRIL